MNPLTRPAAGPILPLMSVQHLLNPKAVLAHLKASQTTYPQVKSFFASPGRPDRIGPGEVAEKAGVDVALWAMRVLPEASHRVARQLAAAFAFGPDGELADAYGSATKGCRMLGDGIDLLMAWLDGQAPDEDARRMRWDLSVYAQKLSDGPRGVIDTLGCAFAPHAWGGCGLAHEYAIAAHAKLLGKSQEAKKEAIERANGYHAFLVGDMAG